MPSRDEKKRQPAAPAPPAMDDLDLLLESEDVKQAAVKIQAVYKGFKTRKSMAQTVDEARAAMKIQSMFRTWRRKSVSKRLSRVGGGEPGIVVCARAKTRIAGETDLPELFNKSVTGPAMNIQQRASNLQQPGRRRQQKQARQQEHAASQQAKRAAAATTAAEIGDLPDLMDPEVWLTANQSSSFPLST